MNKRVLSTILSVALALLLMTTAFADWQPSKTQKGVTGSDAAIVDKDGNETKIEIISAPKQSQSGVVENIETATDVYIKITPVEETLKANENHDAAGENENKSFWDKAHDGTESGLSYSTNEDTNLVYRSVQKADSTSQFLDSVNSTVRQDVEDTIQAKVEAKKEELNTKAAALEDEVKQLEAEGKAEEAAAKQQELDAVNAQLAAVNDPDYASVDNYSPLGLFDVSASAGALEAFGDGSSVTIEVQVDGVNAESDLIGIHFFGEMEDYDAVREGLENDYDNTVMKYDHEILDVTPTENGTVRFSMSHFSPVMILTRVEAEKEAVAAVAEREEPAAEEASEAEPAPAEPEPEAGVTEAPETAEAEQGTSYTWIIVLAVIVVAAAVVAGVLVRRNNKKKSTSNK